MNNIQSPNFSLAFVSTGLKKNAPYDVEGILSRGADRLSSEPSENIIVPTINARILAKIRGKVSTNWEIKKLKTLFF